MCKQTSLAPTLVCPLSISPSVRLSDFHSNSLKVLTNRRYNIVVADMDEDKLADKKRGVRVGKKSLKKAAPGKKYLTKKPPREMIPESNQKVKNCHLCPYQNIKRSQMYSHYSLSHYREDLAQLIDQKTMECPYCGLKKNNLIRHIGSAHNIVGNFLPVEFHLPRPTIGNFFLCDEIVEEDGESVCQNTPKEDGEEVDGSESEDESSAKKRTIRGGEVVAGAGREW